MGRPPLSQIIKAGLVCASSRWRRSNTFQHAYQGLHNMICLITACLWLAFANLINYSSALHAANAAESHRRMLWPDFVFANFAHGVPSQFQFNTTNEPIKIRFHA